ncbi:MliC family protein [Salinisphaera orenii]|uniref:C-type lysozyme inhibitor domain-containing protein n=1 Tax=Salinisphaera orenii YIM 95161 TaxID=1051139 RepID=A0A423PSN9_9GAMM|nr:MliC family protein [Salinisphaera halophila]ROO28572.1 hypothetical protein SAHL_10010 [Salinisphaera halophila YIM 95161]
MLGRLVAGPWLVAWLCLAAGCAGQRPAAPSAPPDGPPGGEALSLVTYGCDNDATIRATYPTPDIALVQYRGNSRQMQATRSADGARCVSDTRVWRTEGSGPGASATLYHRDDDGDAGRVLARCREIAPAD